MRLMIAAGALAAAGLLAAGCSSAPAKPVRPSAACDRAVVNQGGYTDYLANYVQLPSPAQISHDLVLVKTVARLCPPGTKVYALP